jgi:hypothetical protein
LAVIALDRKRFIAQRLHDNFRRNCSIIRVGVLSPSIDAKISKADEAYVIEPGIMLLKKLSVLENIAIIGIIVDRYIVGHTIDIPVLEGQGSFQRKSMVNAGIG